MRGGRGHRRPGGKTGAGANIRSNRTGDIARLAQLREDLGPESDPLGDA
jgi:hypothetical protein